MSKNKAKQLSTTQKLFNRKEVVSNKKQVHHMPNQRLSKDHIAHLQKDDLQQLRKAELKQKAKERKQKLDNDDFLKFNREQMMTNVSQVIFKHIEAAENYIEEPT